MGFFLKLVSLVGHFIVDIDATGLEGSIATYWASISLPFRIYL
jgi:hypothetical protein